MSHRSLARRYRVVLRPKVRGERLRKGAATAAVLMLGALAAVTVRHVPLAPPPWRSLRKHFLPPPAAVVLEGVPEGVREQVLAQLAAHDPGAPADAKAEALLRRFGFLSSVRVRRDWLRRTLRVEARLHEALGRAEIQGRAAGYLSEDGSLFAAPEGLYGPREALPALDVSGAGPAELKALAAFLAETRGGQVLPARMERMHFLSPADGWEARLADGTIVLWGRLEWTAEKLARLRAVLDDARPHFEGRMRADMRYFEDGKILLKPVGAENG